jgi:hypothetical protein
MFYDKELHAVWMIAGLHQNEPLVPYCFRRWKNGKSFFGSWAESK